MILYAVSYKGSITHDDWSIVTIHRTYENAVTAMNKYNDNLHNIAHGDGIYCISKIDTDYESDTVYDFDESYTQETIIDITEEEEEEIPEYMDDEEDYDE